MTAIPRHSAEVYDMEDICPSCGLHREGDSLCCERSAQPDLEYVPICPSCLEDCEGSSFAPFCSSACRLRGQVEAM